MHLSLCKEVIHGGSLDSFPEGGSGHTRNPVCEIRGLELLASLCYFFIKV